MEIKPLYLDNPPEGLAEKIEGLFASSDTKVRWADSDDTAALAISWPDDRKDSDGTNIYSGGYIACANAFKAAARSGMDLTTFGEFLNLLDVKLRQCQLGCF